MRRLSYILFTFIFALFTLCAIAQQPQYPDSGFTNKAEAKNLIVNGLKEGKWMDYIDIWGDTTTNVKDAFGYGLLVYKANKPLGVVRYYFESDTITGTNRGKFVYASPNIDVSQVTEMDCYDKGMLHSQVMYANGKKEGTQKTYFDDGKIQDITHNKNGRRNGMDDSYYENGKLSDEVPYINDTVNGVCKSYSERGVLVSEVPYTYNTINGVLKEYDTSGVLTKEVPYKMGKKNGVLKMYYFFSGKLQFEIPYVNDKLSGEAKHYDEKGDRIE